MAIAVGLLCVSASLAFGGDIRVIRHALFQKTVLSVMPLLKRGISNTSKEQHSFAPIQDIAQLPFQLDGRFWTIGSYSENFMFPFAGGLIDDYATLDWVDSFADIKRWPWNIIQRHKIDARLGKINVDRWLLSDIVDFDSEKKSGTNIFHVAPRYRQPSPIGFDGGIVAFFQSEANKFNCYYSGDGGNCRYPIEPFGYAQLPFPEGALCGVVLFLCGGWLSGRQLEKEHSPTHIGWWFIAVLGGCMFLLSVIPQLAALSVS